MWSVTLVIEFEIEKFKLQFEIEEIKIMDFEVEMWRWGVELNLEEKKFPDWKVLKVNIMK